MYEVNCPFIARLSGTDKELEANEKFLHGDVGEQLVENPLDEYHTKIVRREGKELQIPYKGKRTK